jgi:hypothetical protein
VLSDHAVERRTWAVVIALLVLGANNVCETVE